MTYEQAEAILERCAHERRDCELSSGRHVCVECYNAYVRARKAARRAQLDDLPRCEVASCTARGAWTVGHARVLLCGRHKERVRRAHLRECSQLGGLALFLPVDFTRDEILDAAVKP